MSTQTRDVTRPASPWDVRRPCRQLSPEELALEYPARPKPEPEAAPILPYSPSARDRAAIKKQRDLEKSRKR